jgi:hypothetical protein
MMKEYQAKNELVENASTMQQNTGMEETDKYREFRERWN